MRPDNNPVTCPWTAEQLNDKTISFVPNRSGRGGRTVGQIIAAEVSDGLYIQISPTNPNSRRNPYWLSQEEANRIQRSGAESGIDFILV